MGPRAGAPPHAPGAGSANPSARAKRTLAAGVQARLLAFYELEEQPEVDDFAFASGEGEREVVLLKEHAGEVAIAVGLPREGLEEDREGLSLDTLCQVVEGVSHFVYLAERIRTEAPTTELELELQAEVDKFVILAHGQARSVSLALHARLYENVTFLHERGSTRGERYRYANELAARFCARLGDPSGALARLRRFYRGGQAEKIHLALAA